jgi:hypothetical protein
LTHIAAATYGFDVALQVLLSLLRSRLRAA